MQLHEIERIYSFVVNTAFSAPKSDKAREREREPTPPPPPPSSAPQMAVPAHAAATNSRGHAAGTDSLQTVVSFGGNAGASGGGGRDKEDGAGERGKEAAIANGWWSKLMQSSSSIKRVLLQGAKYDATPLLTALRAVFGAWCEQCMVDHALQRNCCQAAIVSTLVSERPIRPFIFRSYQLPQKGVSGLGEVFLGTCRASWLEAMRASSAAPYFFDEFACMGERFQDGAIVANNPALQGLHEAQRLWPGRAIEVLVSVGTGKDVIARRGRGSWGLVESFGEFMIESATSSDRVAEAIEVLSPLVPRTSFFRLQVEHTFNPKP
jgi:hypothetical protein